MGTNYYLTENCCGVCGRGDTPLHIGKSSAGWCFSLHVYPDKGINNLEDWVKRFRHGEIRNEYGETLTAEQMLTAIRERKGRTEWNTEWWKHGYTSEPQFHERNHSERGPNGLLRHRIDGHCIGWGDGPWDFITGDFS